MNFKILTLILYITGHQGSKEWTNVISAKILMVDFDMSTSTQGLYSLISKGSNQQHKQFDSNLENLRLKI